MKTGRMSGLMAVLMLGGAASIGLADVPASARPGIVQERVLELVNEARAHRRTCGREHFPAAPPLLASEPLRKAAAAHARDMARRNYFDHRAPDGSEPRDRVSSEGYRSKLTGENIAFGPETVEEVVAGWLNSPGHCANIMDARFRELGSAVAKGRKRGHYYWVQNLGAPAL